MKRLIRATGSVLLMGAFAAVAGCGANPDRVDYGYIKSNLSPELIGLADRPIDLDRNTAIMVDHNRRMLVDDVWRAMYWDHPSRLSPYPVTYTSGHPR